MYIILPSIEKYEGLPKFNQHRRGGAPVVCVNTLNLIGTRLAIVLPLPKTQSSPTCIRWVQKTNCLGNPLAMD